MVCIFKLTSLFFTDLNLIRFYLCSWYYSKDWEDKSMYKAEKYSLATICLIKKKVIIVFVFLIH